jgi:hypothetical protein
MKTRHGDAFSRVGKSRTLFFKYGKELYPARVVRHWGKSMALIVGSVPSKV